MKTATHKAKGEFRDFYYRRLQVARKMSFMLKQRTANWEFYCNYQNKWITSAAPHSGMTEL